MVRHKISPSKSTTSSKSIQTRNVSYHNKSRKKRSKPGVAVLRQIRYLQKTVHLLIPKRPMSSLIREILYKRSKLVGRMTLEAIQALHEASEIYLEQLLTDSYLVALHSSRKTLMAKDIQIVRRLRGYNL